MPRFALRVAWYAAATGLASIAGCSLDLNGTGSPLVEVSEAPDASSPGPDGTVDTLEGAVASDAADAGPFDATVPDGSQPDASVREASAPDGTPPDVVVIGGGDGSVDAPTCATASGGACIVVPPGWSIVAFSEDRAEPCPNNFNAGSNDVVEAPNATNACSCGTCTVTSQPACDQGTIGATYGSSNGGGFGGFGGGGGQATCTTPGTGLVIDPQGCAPYPTVSSQGPNGFDSVQYAPPAPAGGSCSSPGVADPSQVTYGAEERVCAAGASVTQACSGSQPCAANVDSDYMICIMMPGAPVACPTGSLLSTPHWVGGQANLACSDCGCAIDSDTCSGTLDTFRDDMCNAMDTTFRVDGTCQGSFSATNAVAFQFEPDAVNASCTASGTSLANIALTSPATVCCSQ